MKFGFFVPRTMIDLRASDPYAKVADVLGEMEGFGYEICYVGHHRFASQTAFGQHTAVEPSAPLIMATALLARSQKMKVCTNIMLVPSRHPVELAEEINTLNEISNNRFILGGGIGYKADEFETCGWNFKTRAKRFEECLGILRLALTGKEFSYSGKHFNIPPVAIMPPPLHGVTPPLWIGAVSEAAMKRAGRLGDGWLISFAEHLIELQDKIKVYKSIAAEHGRPSTLCLMRDLHIAPTKSALDPNWLPNVIKVWQSYADLGAQPDRDEESKEVMFGGKSITLEEFAPNRAIVGSPEDCLKETQRVKDLINPDYLMLTPTGVPDPDNQVKELKLFAKEVMPFFKG